MLTVGMAVRIKDGKKGRPKKWYIVKFMPADDTVNDLVVLECPKTHEQTMVNLDNVVVYPVKVYKPLDELAKQAQELDQGY